MIKFDLPPRIHSQSGQLRCVGFELEFGGVDVNETAEILVQLFGGQIERVNEYIVKIQTRHGEFQVEADATFLKEKKYERYFRAMGLNVDESTLAKGMEGMIASLAGTLIPFEVIMPPLPINQLDAVELIRASLQQHSAKGTKSSVFMAFGMQFNPEVPDFEVATLLGYLRAFFLLFDWLFVESDIPLSRKLAPYIHSFPNEYINLVLNPEYAPDLQTFMRDYLHHNSTRNRPLDMLPLFAHIDRALVDSFPVEHHLIKSRPTFHYRLPNSEVDDPNWSVATEWNKWVQIERLAGDPERIKMMSEDFRDVHANTMLFARSKWVQKTRDWLHG